MCNQDTVISLCDQNYVACIHVFSCYSNALNRISVAVALYSKINNNYVGGSKQKSLTNLSKPLLIKTIKLSRKNVIKGNLLLK